MSLVYIGAGSNLGERRRNIEQAGAWMEARGLRVLRLSSLYETEAVCRPGERMPPFLNAVFEVETDRSPEDLLETLEGIEQGMGRQEKGMWRPRPIDLDILFYGDRLVDSARLKVPHPEASKRWFVLKPLADLVPEFVHPVLGKTIKELLCKSSSIPPM